LHLSETDRQVRDEIGQQSVMQQLHIRLDRSTPEVKRSPQQRSATFYTASSRHIQQSG